MSDHKRKLPQSNILKKTLDSIAFQKRAPKYVFILLLLLYLFASGIVSMSAGSQTVLSFGGIRLPIYAFAGVFSSVANICIIFMAVYCGKAGFLTALFCLLFQIPMIMMGIILHHNYTSIPGVFGDVLTIIAIIVIRVNNVKVDNYQAKLRDQAVTDILTGLPNRFACSELLQIIEKHEDNFAVVSIDVNGFKSINDTLGFYAGNEVLKEISSRWKVIADSGLSGTLDFIARLSGDEFALIVRNYSSPEEIENTIRKYDAALGDKLTVENCDFYITASFGYAEFPKDAQTSDGLFTCADAAMQEVKRLGNSNHILRFTPELMKDTHIMETEWRIRNALDNDTVFFHLQPQFDMSHQLRGFEALARMKDESGQIISPGEFIPVAEKVGLVDKIDAAVFRKAAAFFGEVLKNSGKDILLSINVSVKHLMKNDFLDEVREVLSSSNVPADHLEIEITESVMIESAEKALQCIAELSKMGIKIAIDDFGTGYSSLSYLNNFPANLLKIDKSFIDKMNANDSSKNYVEAIISMGHVMGFDVISEGVEENNQIHTLQEIGCDYIQGFVWGRPLPPEEAEKLVMSA